MAPRVAGGPGEERIHAGPQGLDLQGYAGLEIGVSEIPQFAQVVGLLTKFVKRTDDGF